MGHHRWAFAITSRKGRVKQLSILTVLVGLIITGVTLIPATEAFANASTAEVAAGGIVFVKSENVRMLEETLHISVKRVNVKYRFLNESDQDVHSTVAFPLPLYDIRAGNGPYDDARAIMATFKVWVAGRPVSTEISRKALDGDRDITALLREVGLSDKQIFDDADLTSDSVAALEKLEREKGKSFDWKGSDTAFWQQSFPAGKEIVIELSYKPLAGNSYNEAYDKNNGGYTPREPRWSPDEYRNKACLDKRSELKIAQKIAMLVNEGAVEVHLNADNVAYILATGRNWKGPIGTFTLRIEKGAPDEEISLCFPGKPKKISPTIYEFYKRDFVPPDELVVFFYSVGTLMGIPKKVVNPSELKFRD
ncbi:MAG: DUF4424 family protein [Desulfomonilaceae bacterium]